ncbi:MAG: hypothetical protein R6V83_06145 [Candidatus Thorarchaeota archaeon]
MDVSDVPRKGEYGDPTQRCAWCGKPVDYFDRCLWGGTCRRNYCSLSCRAAGDYYCNIGLSICITPIALTFGVWFLQHHLTDGRLFSFIALLGIFVSWGWGVVVYGYAIRKQNP